ncbi:MAG TPA: GxxExxY protein [Gammaproteobacteria bacterium]|nr:GxxExxY protein [Gammaproteobacteria bacterium]
MEMKDSNLSGNVIGAAIEVHRIIGPGLLESAYQECLVHELRLRGLSVECEVPICVDYKGLVLGHAYRADLLVEGRLIVELKTVEQINPVHKAQLLTYLRLLKKPLGLLINFNTAVLKDGVCRVVNNV